MLNLKFQQMKFFAQQKLLILIIIMIMMQFPMKIVNFQVIVYMAILYSTN